MADADRHASGRDISETPHDAEAARKALRSFTTATARGANGLNTAVKYIVGVEGHPVAPLPVALVNAGVEALLAPDETEAALQLLVEPVEVDAQGADADRWRIYHGPPTEPRFFRLNVLAARHGGEVFDASQIVARSPLAKAEPWLCRRLNRERRADLRAWCRRAARVDIPEPLAVGIDSYGVDVRARFGVVRLEFGSPMNDEASARAALEHLLDEAAASGEDDSKERRS